MIYYLIRQIVNKGDNMKENKNKLRKEDDFTDSFFYQFKIRIILTVVVLIIIFAFFERSKNYIYAFLLLIILFIAVFFFNKYVKKKK